MITPSIRLLCSILALTLGFAPHTIIRNENYREPLIMVTCFMYNLLDPEVKLLLRNYSAIRGFNVKTELNRSLITIQQRLRFGH